MTEQQFLRIHRTGRIDAELQAIFMPRLQLRRDVLIQMSAKISVFIAGTPDDALQHFQRRRFHVIIHISEKLLDQRFDTGLRPVDFGTQGIECGCDVRLFVLMTQEFGQTLTCIRKKHLMHETNVSGSAFNISDDGADHFASSRRRCSSHWNRNSSPSRWRRASATSLPQQVNPWPRSRKPYCNGACSVEAIILSASAGIS